MKCRARLACRKHLVTTAMPIRTLIMAMRTDTCMVNGAPVAGQC